MNAMTVEMLHREKEKDFSLEVIGGRDHLGNRKLTTGDVFRPGLALAGYTGYFLTDRIMIIGKTETSYMKTLSRSIKNKRLATIMRLGTPCIIVTKKLPVDPMLKVEAAKRRIPILRTPLSTTPFIHALSGYLDYKLAPTEYMHGTLVDVYGVGVLFTGKAGTGKSECALDLIERGHRLVADDLIRIVRRGKLLIGSGAEKSERLKHHLEIRGVGLVDIYRIFGVKSVRMRKRIEIIIELVFWNEAKGEYDRVGLDYKRKDVLGVKTPYIVIPLTPGKNISVIAEVIAMNYLLELRGIYTAKEYDKELKKILSQPQRTGNAEDDFE
ncbi:MAG TPA: HPr(Ser) kinase/phosphatase [bacterium]